MKRFNNLVMAKLLTIVFLFPKYGLAQDAALIQISADQREVANEFYFNVLAEIRAQKTWDLLDQEKTMLFLRKIAPHTPVATQTPIVIHERFRATVDTAGIIPEVQELLDTLALDVAVLTHCTPADDAERVKSCSLFLYDRSSAKVRAQVEKKFAVPIRDASRWGAPMVAQLKAGITATEKKKQMENIHSLSEKSSEKQSSIKLGAAAAINYQPLQVKGEFEIASTAALHAQIRVVGERQWVGLGFSHASAAQGYSSYSHKQFYILATSYVRAMETAQWHLGIGPGYGIRTIKNNQTERSIEKSQLFFAGHLQLLWEIFGSVNAGIGIQWQQYVSGKDRVKNSPESKSTLDMQNSDYALGIWVSF